MHVCVCVCCVGCFTLITEGEEEAIGSVTVRERKGEQENIEKKKNH